MSPPGASCRIEIIRGRVTWAGLARSFAARVKINFDTPVRAQPEDQLKAPVVELIEGSGTLFARNVEARTKAQVQGLGARPDIGVAVDRLLSGFVELKAPGKGARPERFTGADREQWQDPARQIRR